MMPEPAQKAKTMLFYAELGILKHCLFLLKWPIIVVLDFLQKSFKALTNG